ncbi:MAG: hypothetical protein ABJC89_23190 [Acidobacteriota bacterium]
MAALALSVSVSTGDPRGGRPEPRRPVAAKPAGSDSLLETTLLVTWYGNPHSGSMGVLGRQTGSARADALTRQAAAYAPLTGKGVLPAYHLVAVIAQPTPGRDEMWRRRESADVIWALLAEARANGFALILDVQPGRSTVKDEVAALRTYLAEPDVHLALDPEFDMAASQIPGRKIGSMAADDVNAALDILERLKDERQLPPKVLIVHQFTLAMLPDKEKIRTRRGIDLVLDMDGVGSQALKRSSYRAIFRQAALPYAGVKLFYRQDTGLFGPAQALSLTPLPSVVIYQ